MNPSETRRDFLNIIQMIIQFNDPNQYEVDNNDLQELLLELNIECLNILTISKNNFFIVLKRIEDVKLCFQKMNNFFIEKLQARVEINLCIQSEESSFIKAFCEYNSVFEIECPRLEYFDIRRRVFGVDNYNIERIKNMCEKDFFEGSLVIEDVGVEEGLRVEC